MFLKYNYEKNKKRRQDFRKFKKRKRSKNRHEFRKKALLTIFVDMSAVVDIWYAGDSPGNISQGDLHAP